ncbi:MAG: hypothetical protein JWO42_3550, partial [Chloroflexi bacterium]|nr:hypothetical protein [Chloroflexota bacterium]
MWRSMKHVQSANAGGELDRQFAYYCGAVRHYLEGRLALRFTLPYR